MVGHSRGALEAAHCAYVENDTRIQAVIAIAGRFKVTPPPDRAPRDTLIPTVASVEGALATAPPDNLYQIGAGQDWCIPLEASLTVGNPNHRLLLAQAMHLNILYAAETRSQLAQWLQEYYSAC